MNQERKILIVDDDEFLLDMYSLKFRENGYGVDIAMSSQEALEKIKNGFLPDIILLDIIMPKIDGFDFLKSLREQNLAPAAKIIILSNLGQKEDIEKGMALGASDYIVKAYFTPTEIVKKVETLL